MTRTVSIPQKLLSALAIILLSTNLSWSQVDRFIKTSNFTNSPGVPFNYSVHGAYQYCSPLCYRGTGPDEYIASATMGRWTTDSVFRQELIHFMHFNYDGMIKRCNPYIWGGYQQSSFLIRPDTAYMHEIHSVATFTNPNTTEAYIVSQVQRTTGTSKASINILRLDNCTGVIAWNKTLSTPGRNLYVMDAIFAESNDIFMTGFSTDTSGANKKILFINYDVPTASFNAVEVNTTTSATLPYDFDMGMTVRRVINGVPDMTPTVVGSCNSNYGSASLLLRINKTNLAVDDIFFVVDTVNSNGEYAFDMEEIQEGYGLFSNKYRQTADNSGPLGFKPNGLHPMISYVHRNQTTQALETVNNGALQRWHLRSSSTMPDTNWAWGTHIDLDGPYISGVVAYKDPNASNCNLNGNTTPTIDEAVPFMAKIDYSFRPTDNNEFRLSGITYWRQYHSDMSRSFYNRMGSQLNNTHWPNNFSFHNRYADNPGVTTDQMLMATNYDHKKFKTIRTTSTLVVNPSSGSYASACSASVVSCIPTKVNVNLVGANPSWTRDTLVLTVTNAYSIVALDTLTDTNYCANTGAFKPSGIPESSTGYTIYPNPTTGQLHIMMLNAPLPGVIIDIDVYDMSGRKISSLYKGNASGLSPDTTLSLENINTGLYILRISSDKEVLHQEKISVIK